VPEVWGGLECTVNRIGNEFHDQVARSGHAARVDDIDRLADMGVRRVRYPLLWERIQPERGMPMRWDALDAHLMRLRARGVAPIAGLVHHGSGPRHTNLLDPAFPGELAAYALTVAQRYPWIDMWTPVNEPVSTARFSGLYGHWYPHECSDASFVRMLLHECRAAVLAMAAIRSVIPGARYMHTDDMGVISSSPRLAYQAEFENERQFVALDLMAGRVVPGHPMRRYLARFGATAAELTWFEEQALLPDVVAGDYYISSDRHLDDDVASYPGVPVGGNRRHRYVDIAASERAGWEPGFEAVLHRMWTRYGRSVAIGEVHIDGTREAQLRWTRSCWEAAVRAEAAGVPVTAVTFWALLGTFDWNDLCRGERGHYETGAFDIRGAVPRPTALAAAITSISHTGAFSHPVIPDSASWTSPGGRDALTLPRAPLLILGARGTLGRALTQRCEQRGISHVALGRAELDITRSVDVEPLVAALRPWAVINASGYVRVDDAELEPEQCRAINVHGAVNVARACERMKVRLVTFSSDLVFDGAKASPYIESDAPSPLSVYGQSKRDGEIGVLSALPDAIIVRTSAFFGAADDHNFVIQTLRRLIAGESVPTSGSIVSPTDVSALADAVLDLIVDGADGMWHLSSPARLSWTEWARSVAAHANLDQSLIYQADAQQLAWRGVRPDYSALGTERGQQMPEFEESMARCVASWQAQLT